MIVFQIRGSGRPLVWYLWFRTSSTAVSHHRSLLLQQKKNTNLKSDSLVFLKMFRSLTEQKESRRFLHPAGCNDEATVQTPPPSHKHQRCSFLQNIKLVVLLLQCAKTLSLKVWKSATSNYSKIKAHLKTSTSSWQMLLEQGWVLTCDSSLCSAKICWT